MSMQIAPGFTKTEMTDKVPQEIIDQALAQIPLKRMGEQKILPMQRYFLHLINQIILLVKH